ncbi:MAG: thioredoxin family protein [bacterium]|nr:thioredoxin family protein [bacterium]
MSSFFAERRPHQGLDPDAYRNLLVDQAAAVPPADDEAVEKHAATQLNLHRTQRLLRHWRPSDELAALAIRVEVPQLWMVLTEPWCGDSAQCLPCITVLAGAMPSVELRLILRDENLDIMDQFLTDGKRSIPVLVAFDEGGAELFRWGPRPVAAQAVVDQAKAEGLEKPEMLERLHLWYGRDRGATLDTELVAMLRGHLDRP